jgi:hypothetical protein
VTQLTVSRWTRYGKDRLYVSTTDGVKIGWQDLLTGHVTVDQPELADLLHAALSDHPASVSVVPGTDRPSVAPHTPVAGMLPLASSPVPPALIEAQDSEWLDLAANVPGQAARQQAQVELASAKDRSRVASFLARALDIKTDERAWRVGAAGEETVGTKLAKLTKHGWHVLHAIPVGDRGSDIDHVLVGPGGVFTINTKNHPGKKVWVGKHVVKVDGQSTQYLRNSRFEAERAQKLLAEAVGWPVFVRPVLVLLMGSLNPDVTIKEHPEDVVILDRMDIPGVFKRSKQSLDPEQVESIYAQARRDTTWRQQQR